MSVTMLSACLCSLCVVMLASWVGGEGRYSAVSHRHEMWGEGSTLRDQASGELRVGLDLVLWLPGLRPSCRPPVTGGWSAQRGSSPGPRTRWWSCQGSAGGAGAGVTWWGTRGHLSGLTGGLSSPLMSEWKRFSELSAAAFALLLHTDREKPVIARFIWKEIKYGFVLICHLYGATRTQPVAVSPFTANPVIHFFYWMTFRSHSPPTDILHFQLILFQFRNWQKSRNFSVWVSKSNLMMVSQITIMCMKSGQGETLEIWELGLTVSQAARTKKGSEDQSSAGIHNELWIFHQSVRG